MSLFLICVATQNNGNVTGTGNNHLSKIHKTLIDTIMLRQGFGYFRAMILEGGGS